MILVVCLLVVLCPKFAIAEDDWNKVPGIAIYTANPNPARGYIAFSNAFNGKLIGRWKEASQRGLIRGVWAVFIRQEDGQDSERSDVVIFVIREGDGERLLQIAVIPPEKQFSQIAAEAAAGRAMRLIIAEEKRERRVGR